MNKLLCNNLQTLNEDVNVEQNGRQPVISTYIQYQCKIPHPLATSSSIAVSRSGDELER